MILNKSLLNYIHVKQGDITKETTDAIVNAANPSLLGGGGVDGAIHKAAGIGLFEECRSLGGCKHGEARITSGYNLKAKYVVHTPGPVYKDGKQGEPEILKNSYINSLLLAKEKNLKSISFPAISTGVYGYPKEEACKIAIETVVDFMEKYNFMLNIYFVLFDKENFSLYSKFLNDQG
jgi:O-acetyl-ADP-ribose deacetylase (regulator of RNase III)